MTDSGNIALGFEELYFLLDKEKSCGYLCFSLAFPEPDQREGHRGCNYDRREKEEPE